MARSRADFNIQRRVSMKGGWLFLGVSLGGEVRRTLVDLNDEGYRVAFIVPDQPSFLWYVMQVLVGTLTLGFFYRRRGLLIIGERLPVQEA